MRVGVSGHRSFDDPDDVTRRVDRVLDRLAGDPYVVVSALAEGADRLVVDRVLARPGGALEALLPLDPSDYEDDFADAASVAAFHDRLARADEVEVTDADPADASREAAYERAGFALLDRVDVLVALWDGEASHGRGGTAEVVADARRRGLPVEVVAVTRP